jgi:superfamily I DNA/RNA helicase
MNDLSYKEKEERNKYLQLIIESDSPKKLIVSGPGTGKTYTFKELFQHSGSSNNLALTFIRKLVNDLENELGSLAEVKTFHAFCKKLLHEKKGGFDLYPFLTEIINEDSVILGYQPCDFSKHFQLLNEDSPLINFYLDRGNYYNAVCFDDSVYRVLKISETDPNFIPRYDQIVIDEYQDFNPLEVAFIDELQRYNSLLIAGDDDQAVYSQRNSSPEFIREKYYSGDYELFELPFCSRCPRAVVEATRSFIDSVKKHGGLKSRIDKKFLPYLEGNEETNSRYPKIVSAQISNIRGVSNFIKSAIEKIPEREIQEANDGDYPCVLIIGKKQYLNPIAKELSEHYSRIDYSFSSESSYSLLDAYKIISSNPESNIGWRIIASFMLDQEELESVLKRTIDSTPIVNLLSTDFVEQHRSILELLRNESLNLDELNNLIESIDVDFNPIIEYFSRVELEEESEPDYSEPSIMFTSFEGCKGLSACHVFIVGLNRGVVPQLNEEKRISDIEVSKFIVAMTRTRKLLYLLSNRYDYDPKKGRNNISPFLSLIPNDLKIMSDYIKSDDISDFLDKIFIY